ncbi:hypothetical protein BGZ73_001865 [Actinomortierella ambigua]|nr:hypothetical protein BGZ73_001865 [Actinomortierella ambigua]
MSDFMHRVTHPHFGHRHQAGEENPNHPQHAKQNVQPPPHQYGGPEDQHDLAYEAEANLPGAHAIPPFGLSRFWPGKKSHAAKTAAEQQQQASTEPEATTTTTTTDTTTDAPTITEAENLDLTSSSAPALAQASEPEVAPDAIPAPVIVDSQTPSSTHPMNSGADPEPSGQKAGHDKHHAQEAPAGLNQLQA